MEEPTDEMLQELMEDVAKAAWESSAKAETELKRRLSETAHIIASRRLKRKTIANDWKASNPLCCCWSQWLWQDHNNSPVVEYITQRYLNGGHEVPISKVISRYYKSLINAEEAISFVDRAYVYDNSIDNQLPRLLYRTIDGQLFKQYADNIPEWARLLLK